MPALPTNPQSIGSSGHVNDHNTIVTNLSYMLNSYQMGNKNRLINSNFAINQRGYTSTTNLASGAYGFDRWKSGYTNTSLTFTAAPQGQTVTISTSGVLQQVIERANMPAGSYTLSWTGTATGRVYNSGASAPAYAASPITVSLDGTANVVVEFTASGGTKTLANPQLEAGTSATVYEFEDYSRNLARCLRYCFVFGGDATYQNWGIGPAASGTNVYQLLRPLPVPLRATPAAGNLTTSGNFRLDDGVAASYAVTAITLDTQGTSSNTVVLGAQVASGLTSYRMYWLQANNSTASRITISVEL